MSEKIVSRDTPEYRRLRRAVVQMEINDLAAIAAVRERRRVTRRWAAMLEMPRAIGRFRLGVNNNQKERRT